MKLSKFLTTLGVASTFLVFQASVPTNTSKILVQEGFNLWGDSNNIWAGSTISVGGFIPVCWETSGSNIEKSWVQWSIEATWERNSAVDFTGWGSCTSNSQGIRIAIRDEGPRVASDQFGNGLFGNKLNGVPSGMILNFTFNQWSPACQDGGDVPHGFNNPNRIQSNNHREFCIKAIAVHEFGHALGFYHEQDRPGYKLSESCKGEQTRTPTSGNNFFIGYWDLDSVMNYCNPNWNGSGNLSSTDISGVQQMYGGKSEDEYLVGDWDGDGKDNIAVRRGNKIVRDFNYDGNHDREQSYGNGNSEENQYLVGDWDGDGKDNIAVRRGNKILMDFNYDGSHDREQSYGNGNSENQYLVGDWDGDGKDNVAVRRGNKILMDFNYDGSHDREQSYGNG